jgi:dinuclear metal center YbgI/SA1388 family protein
MKIGEVVTHLGQFYPESWAEPWDQVGLLVGDPSRDITKVLIALDLNEAVLEEAQKQKANLVLTHHPTALKADSFVRPDRPTSKFHFKAIEKGIAHLAIHTNFDQSPYNGLEKIGLKLGMAEDGLQRLASSDQARFIKLVAFIPEEHFSKVSQAVFEAGAGHIGEYSHCGFSLEGEGSFLPGEKTDPFIGRSGKLEKVQERRFETVLPQAFKGRVLKALKEAHPYEEVAYDLYSLKDVESNQGYGIIGELENPILWGSFLSKVQAVFDAPNLVTYAPDRRRSGSSKGGEIKRVAFLNGAGGSFLRKAISARADVYITSDITHHYVLEAIDHGLYLIDLGHDVSERFFTEVLGERLSALSLNYEISEAVKRPLRSITKET